jgi:hypothetical protein
MSAIEMGLEGNWSWSFGRGIVMPMDGLSKKYMNLHGW